jgi:hypothetical protein
VDRMWSPALVNTCSSQAAHRHADKKKSFTWKGGEREGQRCCENRMKRKGNGDHAKATHKHDADVAAPSNGYSNISTQNHHRLSQLLGSVHFFPLAEQLLMYVYTALAM